MGYLYRYGVECKPLQANLKVLLHHSNERSPDETLQLYAMMSGMH